MTFLAALLLLGQLTGAPAETVRTAPKPLCLDRIVPPCEPDRWLAIDKFWHFSASFASTGAGYHLCANRLSTGEPAATATSLGGTLVLGISKEFYDLARPERRFSWKDIVADLAGIGAGYLVFIHRY